MHLEVQLRAEELARLRKPSRQPDTDRRRRNRGCVRSEPVPREPGPGRVPREPGLGKNLRCRLAGPARRKSLHGCANLLEHRPEPGIPQTLHQKAGEGVAGGQRQRPA